MKKCMAANWKMFKTKNEAVDTIQKLESSMNSDFPSDREVVVFPPFTSISAVYDTLSYNSKIKIGGQNFYPASEGAYTGEISPDMLLDLGCTFALVGHSERRHIIQESEEIISQKVDFGINSGLKIILCIGETWEERSQAKLEQVLEKQLAVLKDLNRNNIYSRLEIAYEPVWAIGTGEVARPGDIQEAHLLVREQLRDIYPKEAEDMRILYGGSVKPENTSEIISIDNVDGVLVGGASLDADKFSQIVKAAK